MKHKILPFILFSILSIVVLGCGPIANVDIGRDGATVDIELKEAQVAKILERSDVTFEDDDEAILESIDSVDFREGYIAIEGTYTDDNGESKVGGFDIEMDAMDGMLDVQIVNVTIDNVDPADVEEANQELASEFAKEAENGDVEFRGVSVTESKLLMTVAVNF